MKEKNCFNSVAFLGEPSPERFEAVIHSISEREFLLWIVSGALPASTALPRKSQSYRAQRRWGAAAMKFLDQTSVKMLVPCSIQ